MAYTEERKIWLDKNGKVLVDKGGKPFYTISCCCTGSSSDSQCCWQTYEAYCVDTGGNSIYGLGATGSESEKRWTAPRLVSYLCTTDCEGKTVAYSNNPAKHKWVLDAPGTAHYILKRNDLQQCSTVRIDKHGNKVVDVPCSRPAADVPPPDIPCSCENLGWGAPSAVLPYYTYSIPLVRIRTMYCPRPGASVVAGERLTPQWLAIGMSGGKPLEVEPGTTWLEFTSTYRNGLYYLGNFVTGPMEEVCGFCPVYDKDQNITPEYTEWYKDKMDRIHVTVAHATCNYSVLYNGEYANRVGYAWPYPGGGGYMVAPDFWVVGDTVHRLVQNTEGILMDSMCGTIAAISQMSAATCWVPGFDGHMVCFDEQEWGSLVITDLGGNASFHWVREAHGAYCEVKDTPVVAGVVPKGATVTLDGSPMWEYRAYLTTDLPVGELNASHLAFALGSSTEPPAASSAFVSINAQGLKCPQYWFLFCTQWWSCCFNDPPKSLPFGAPEEDNKEQEQNQGQNEGTGNTGEESPGDGSGAEEGGEEQKPCCKPVQHKERAYRLGERYPRPYFFNGEHTYTKEVTLRLHEADENQDESGNTAAYQPLRKFDYTKDGHLYFVSRLSIDNYPTWYKDKLCEGSLNGAKYDVPVANFDKEAQHCLIYCELEDAPFWAASCRYPATNLKAESDTKENAMGYGRWTMTGRPGALTMSYGHGFGCYSKADRASGLGRCTQKWLPVEPITLNESGARYMHGFGNECDPVLLSKYTRTTSVVSEYCMETDKETGECTHKIVSTYCRYDITDWWDNGSGCPNWRWGAYNAGRIVYRSKVLVTSGNVSNWEPVPSSNEDEYEFNNYLHKGLLKPLTGERFMWEGAVYDSRICDKAFSVWGLDVPCSSEIESKYGDNLIVVTSYVSGGIYMFQWPEYCCTDWVPPTSGGDPGGDEPGGDEPGGDPGGGGAGGIIKNPDPDDERISEDIAKDMYPDMQRPDKKNPWQQKGLVLSAGTVITYKLTCQTLVQDTRSSFGQGKTEHDFDYQGWTGTATYSASSNASRTYDWNNYCAGEFTCTLQENRTLTGPGILCFPGTGMLVSQATLQHAWKNVALYDRSQPNISEHSLNIKMLNPTQAASTFPAVTEMQICVTRIKNQAGYYYLAVKAPVCVEGPWIATIPDQKCNMENHYTHRTREAQDKPWVLDTEQNELSDLTNNWGETNPFEYSPDEYTYTYDWRVLEPWRYPGKDITQIVVDSKLGSCNNDFAPDHAKQACEQSWQANRNKTIKNTDPANPIKEWNQTGALRGNWKATAEVTISIPAPEPPDSDNDGDI